MAWPSESSQLSAVRKRHRSSQSRTPGLTLFVLALIFAASPSTGICQTALTLAKAGARRVPNFVPLYSGEVVVVHGTVSTKPIRTPYYSRTAIQDESGYGLMLEGTPSKFANLTPGDAVQARGTIGARAGLVVLNVSTIQQLGRTRPPSPERVSPTNLNSFRYLGALVSTEGRIIYKGETSGGEYLMLGDRKRPIRIFVPLRVDPGKPALARFEAGDWVRVTGVSSQDCPTPPYDRLFEVIAPDTDGIVLLEKRWLISPELFLSVLTSLAIAIILWWVRERRLALHRHLTRTLYSLGEATIGAGSPPEIHKKLLETLPRLLKISGVRLYLYNRAASTLEPVADPNAKALGLETGHESIPPGPVVCFRNRVLLAIEDVRNSLWPSKRKDKGAPRSIIYVPMFAQAELLGVFKMYRSRKHSFSPDEQVAAQHLANQMAISLRLMEQQSIREQLFRTEKLAAAGQLVSGIAAELGPALDSMVARAEEALIAGVRGAHRSGLESVLADARRAAETVSRLASFTGSDSGEPKPVEINSLLRSLVEFRRREWVARGLEVHDFISSEALHVLGSQGQLERVFLDLLVQAEQAAADSPDKSLAIGTSVLGRRLLIEIVHAAVPAKKGGATSYWEPGSGEPLSGGIIRSYGGELRIIRNLDSECRLEIELPVAGSNGHVGRTDGLPGASPKRTALLVEPDPAARQASVTMLSSRGLRVIPANSAEQALDLVQRLRFDLVFCSIRLPGLNWVEFFERVRARTSAFVLVAEAIDPESSTTLSRNGAELLTKPIDEFELEALLARVAPALSSQEQTAAT